jgi:hypothetical protein
VVVDFQSFFIVYDAEASKVVKVESGVVPQDAANAGDSVGFDRHSDLIYCHCHADVEIHRKYLIDQGG